jgi:hypothetical protein
MRELRWLLRVAPPFAALAAVVALGSASFRATAGTPTSCGDARNLVAATQDAPSSSRAAAAVPGFVITPLLDAAGSLAGQRIEIGTAARTTVSLEVPPESFAAGPFGRAILVGADDGRRSTLRAFDAVSGCAWSLTTEADVIRRATIDSSAGNVYEFRLDRATRADLGVWRRPLDGGAAAAVLAPLAADGRFGRTFSTELSWSEDGDVLVAQSCGVSRCRTRTVEIADGTVRTLDGADQGEVIGLAAGRLVTYGACRGLPCPINSVDVTTGEVATLAPAVGAARIVATGNGPRVVAELGTDDDPALLLVDPASGRSAAVPANVEGWRLVPSAARAEGALAVLPGWALLTRDGRAARPGNAAELLRVDDGATLDLTEVTR